MISITSITIYPIKSISGVSLTEAELCPTGLALDRRWMLVDEENKFISQRSHAQLALLRLSIDNDQFIITHLQQPEQRFNFNFRAHSEQPIQVTVWDDQCQALLVSEEANFWFSSILGMPVKLVYMPDDSKRKVDPYYAIESNNITSFSDGYPILLTSEASLDLLNRKLAEPVRAERFRANIVIDGVAPHEEDHLLEFNINDLQFYGVKPCARCIMTTIDPETGKAGKEPLKTLATYREKNHKILFGQNVIGPVFGKIKIGDTLTVLKRSYS